MDLDANEQQLDFPVVYSSGRDGWCVEDLKNDKSKVAEYAAIEGNVHIQQLKDQLKAKNVTIYQLLPP